MITSQDLSTIYELFGQGVMVGALLSGVVWIIGYAVKVFLGWINQAS